MGDKSRSAEGIAPGDLIGVWRLIGGSITTDDGEVVGRPYGDEGRGLLTLTPDGRMLAVLVDARPGDGAAEREFASYCGDYQFDGRVLTTYSYAFSHPRLSTPQRRQVSFRAGMLVLRPPLTSGADGRHVQRELVWERISTSPA